MRRGTALPALFVLASLLASGSARAANLETLLMPGKVIAGHAQVEEQCSKCHDRADRGRQASLCMECHEAIAVDVRDRTGFHGRQSEGGEVQCRACHTEHRGREADIVKLIRPAFDHRQTDFALTGAHVATECQACHKAGQRLREAPGRCVDCHRADEPHGGQLGADCAACHATASWAGGRFDHSKTRFALRDGHADVACAACHLGNRFRGTPTQCASCHAPDDVHRGSRGQDCASCHVTVAWKTSRFDHLRETGFALAGAHAQVDCKGCHAGPDLKAPLPRDCAGCHRSDDAHATRFGDGCQKCHVAAAWKPATFDHARDGHFALDGRHVQLGCHACHTAVVARQKLGTDCHSCHRTRDVHAGKLGTDCRRCHGADGWRTDVAFAHALSAFPLVGLHAAVPCHECHATPTYQGVAKDCVGCHQHDDRHKGSLGRDCESCHTPNDWRLWEFDHARITGFALAGAHANASCEGCHKQPPEVVKLSGDCASCHVQDDVHLGQFGRQCQRCHGSITFKGAQVQRGAGP
jgi:hypothetical protein